VASNTLTTSDLANWSNSTLIEGDVMSKGNVVAVYRKNGRAEPVCSQQKRAPRGAL
jgi:hypothetical protein